MKKLLAFMLITFVATAPLSAKDAFGARNEANAKTASGKQAKESPFLVSFGTNLSSFLGEEGSWQLGYSLGLTFNFQIDPRLSLTIPLSYNRINAAPRNVEGRTNSDIGENIYKTLSDWQVSVVHIEAPVLFAYKFLTKNNYDIRHILGAGIAIGIKDFSRIEKFTRTDEIIGIEQHGIPLGVQNELLGGGNIITGVRFHTSRFYLDLLYLYYPYEIKDINKLNSISLRLGIDVF